jgi:hypothetical protein
MNSGPVTESISPGETAPLSLDLVRSPPTFTTMIPLRDLGRRRNDFLRLAKKASWIWLFGCRPCSQGKTCLGSGRGCVARCSNATANVVTSIEYIGGESDSLSKRSGGYSTDVMYPEGPTVPAAADRSRSLIDGAGPVGHTGKCLLGTGVGVRRPVLRLRAGDRGGGVEECRIDCCCTTTVAMVASVHCSSLCDRDRLVLRANVLVLKVSVV